MTCDEFEMDLHYRHFRSGSEGIWDIKARDGDVKIELSVYDEVVQEVVHDNFDFFAETIEKELTTRIENDWDQGLLTDEEKFVFLRILGKVLE